MQASRTYNVPLLNKFRSVVKNLTVRERRVMVPENLFKLSRFTLHVVCTPSTPAINIIT